MNEDVPEVLEGEFIPYDENLELVAIEEEAAALLLYYFCGSIGLLDFRCYLHVASWSLTPL